MRQSPPILLWFRRDLRLSDHAALREAASSGRPVLPVFIWDDPGTAKGTGGHRRAPGAASCWWWRHSVAALAEALEREGSRLVIRCGPTLETLLELAREVGADRVVAHALYEPIGPRSEAAFREACRTDGVRVEFLDGCLLTPPNRLRTGGGGPYRVFTPYWRKLITEPIAPPLRKPARWLSPQRWPAGTGPEGRDMLPAAQCSAGFAGTWTPGEAGGRRRLDRLVRRIMDEYDEAREIPGCDGTSRLSPHLHFGEVSARQVWHRVLARDERDRRAGRGDGFLRQLAWREFAHHLLYHFPHTTAQPLRGEFTRFPWRSAPAQEERWREGQTGIPIIDAGMRQLKETGWMHNRVRMLVASFLTKNLRIRWQSGAAWFWESLVDADLANNTLGWQWVAGCGADASPYIRIFNPVTQGERHDGAGAYVRSFVPELAGLPDAHIHRPSAAPPDALRRAGVRLGTSYPRPMVDLAASREEALDAYGRVRPAVATGLRGGRRDRDR